MKLGQNIIPEVVNNFNVYNDDGTKVIGITSEMSLAELNNVVATVQGAGIAGAIETPVVGQYQSISQTIPFRILYNRVMSFVSPLKPIRMNLRGAIQVTDSSTGISSMLGVRYVISGRCKGLTPGTMAPGGEMNASVLIEATYVLLEIDGEKVIEIDKYNNVCRINGVDVLEQVRKLC